MLSDDFLWLVFYVCCAVLLVQIVLAVAWRFVPRHRYDMEEVWDGEATTGARATEPVGPTGRAPSRGAAGDGVLPAAGVLAGLPPGEC